jgi:subtilisin-like proprotein convertase family protein
MRRLAFLLALAALPASAELRLAFERQSLTATYRHYAQYVDGLEVIGAGVIERVDADGSVRELHRELCAEAAASAAGPRQAGRRADVAVNVNGIARPARRVVVEERPHQPYAEYYDAVTGELLRRDALFWNVKARVFETNPVAKLNAPALADHNNAASAVPDAAYSIVDLADDLETGPMLAGPNVRIVDNDAPFTSVHADPSQPLIFDRSQLQFEEVNAYYLIDRTQRYMQSLGFTGPRRLVAYAIPVDPHAVNGTDNSFYVSGNTTGRGQLYFGDGGTDDAEDSDIVIHEFMHSVQDWLAPGIFGGAPSQQSRALSEGIADYWSFSQNYAPTLASGRDPACLADWDARCGDDDPSENCGYPVGADCLRRADSGKTMADYIAVDIAGTEHKNGEIWVSAMRDIFLGLTNRYGLESGRRLADAIVLESMFGTPPSPTFAYEARRLLESDRALTGGASASLICAAMTKRAILAAGDCNQSPRGELTVVQSPQHGIPIPDADPRGIVSTVTVDDPRNIEQLFVTVDVHHPIVADIEIVLTAPDGTTAILQNASLSRSPAGVVTFGRDAQPAQSLDVFRGHPARGTWRLTVRDVSPDNTGTLASWSLVIRFAGDQPLAVRPFTFGARRIIPVVAHLNGAAGAVYRSDLALFNRASSAQIVTAILTPSGADGSSNFAAVKLVVPAGQVVSIRDAVPTLFATSGSGALELQGDPKTLLAWSALYDERPEGRLSQTIESVTPDQAGDSVAIVPAALDGGRTNVGVTEVAGEPGVVRITLRSPGIVNPTFDLPIAPFSHVQRPFAGVLRVDVAVVSGAARVVAYASRIDSVSGDPTYSPSRAAAPAGRYIVPVIADTPGAAGTRWTSQLWIEGAVTSLKAWRADGTPAVINLPPSPSSTLPPFGVPLIGIARGQLDLDLSAGGLASTDIADASRRRDRVPAQPLSDSIGSGESADAFGIQANADARTNVGVAEVNGIAVVVRITIYDGAGNEMESADRFVGARQQLQLPVTAAVTGGRVRFSVVAGGGRVLAYASIVDNRSQDTTFVPAR